MIATISSAAPSPRGTRCSCSQATSGEATAATIPAVSSGSTITWVSASSHTIPTRNTATPTSSHAVSPTSRSHCGTVKIPVSWRGSISMYSSASPLALGVASAASQAASDHVRRSVEARSDCAIAPSG